MNIETCKMKDVPMGEIFIFPADAIGNGTYDAAYYDMKFEPRHYAICVKYKWGRTYGVKDLAYYKNQFGYVMDQRDEVIRTGVKHEVHGKD